MSLKPFSFDPPASLALEGNISWILKEPVLVAWREPHDRRTLSLGQPCPVNGNNQVTMWVGERLDKNLAVVLLQMTISIKISTRKKSFDLFMILPSDQLCVVDDRLSINETPPHVYQCLEQTHSESSEGRRLLRLGCLLHRPSRVLMNIQPNLAKPITGTALHLMLLLKSLSEVLSFDAYIGYSTYATEALRTLKTGIEGGARTPDVDLDNAYAGAGGSLDNWEQYNAEQFSSDTATSRKRRRTNSSANASPRRKDLSNQDTENLESPLLPPYEAPPPSNPRASEPTHPQVLVAGTDSNCAPSPAHSSFDANDYVPESPQNASVDARHVTNDHPIVVTNQLESNADPHDPNLSLSSPLVDSGHHKSADTTLRESMTLWILNMKTVDGDFYKAPRLHPVLLSLASAASRQDTDQFAKAKARGTTIVLARDAAAATVGQRINKNAIPHKAIPNLLRELELFTLWMYGLELEADVAMLPLLRNMALWAVAHRRHTNTRNRPPAPPIQTVDDDDDDDDDDDSDEDAEAADMEKRFRRCEAECVSEFYTQFPCNNQ